MSRWVVGYVIAIAALAVGAGVVMALPSSGQQARPSSAAIGSAFTYQGFLESTGAQVSGSCDFQFGLYDSLLTGSQVGATTTITALTVENGLFATPLDFGSTAFVGESRFLSISVRCPTGSGQYVALSPRQAITPAPQAIYASNAPWTGLAGIPAGFSDGTDDKLTEAEVESFVTNAPIDLAVGTTIGGTPISSASTTQLLLASSVVAYTSSTDGNVDYLTFTVVNTSPTGVPLPFGTGDVVVTYQDGTQQVNLSNSASASTTQGWNAVWLSGSGAQVDPGESVQITIGLHSLATLLGTDTQFTVEMVPTNGDVLGFTRITPPEFLAVNNLDVQPLGGTLALNSSVLAFDTSTDGRVDYLTFSIIASSTLHSVDVTAAGTVTSYLDGSQAVNLSNVFDATTTQGWNIVWLSGNGPILNPGETAEVTIGLFSLSPLLATSTPFSIEMKPAKGGNLKITRTTPSTLNAVNDLN